MLHFPFTFTFGPRMSHPVFQVTLPLQRAYFHDSCPLKSPNKSTSVHTSPATHSCDKPVFRRNTAIVINPGEMAQIHITGRSLLFSQKLEELRMVGYGEAWKKINRICSDAASIENYISFTTCQAEFRSCCASEHKELRAPTIFRSSILANSTEL